MIAAVILAALLVPIQSPGPGSPAPEYVEIDGSKNPEMIPEWSAWEFAFRTIAGGSKLIPTEVLLRLSPSEAELVLAAALANDERDRACQALIQRLPVPTTRESARRTGDRTREIQIECRWETLRARDRLLEALQENPEGQLALVRWVESTKLVTRVSVPKAELAHYRQPQEE